MNLSKLILASAITLGSTGSVIAENLLIGSTSASSSHYGYFVSVGQLINKNADGLKATIVETGATLDNIRRLERKQIDLGLITTNAVQHAVAGTNKFEGKPQDLQLLWIYTIAPQNVIVREDSGVTDLAGLAKVKFNPGIKGSSTEATTEAVFSALDLSADYVRGSTTDIVGGIKDNRLSGYVKSGAGMRLDGSTMDIATATPIRVLGLSSEQKASLADKMPDISLVDVPAGATKDLPAYTTWGFGVGVAASPDLSEESAYQIVKAVMADKTAQVAAMASLKGADLSAMTLQYATIALHPGALRWYSEQGIEVPARLKPAK